MGNHEEKNACSAPLSPVSCDGLRSLRIGRSKGRRQKRPHHGLLWRNRAFSLPHAGREGPASPIMPVRTPLPEPVLCAPVWTAAHLSAPAAGMAPAPIRINVPTGRTAPAPIGTAVPPVRAAGAVGETAGDGALEQEASPLPSKSGSPAKPGACASPGRA